VAAPGARGNPKARARRLSYNDQRELSTLPERLQGLEAEKDRIESQLADGQLYRDGQQALQQRLQRLAVITAELEGGYARWGELEAMAAGN
jgi:ATP-binding cassette subfamily F protein uup